MNAAADRATERNAQLQALLARCRLGDRAAFAQLYDHTSGLLFGIVLRINRDRASAEDVLQEVYVKVWRSAQSYDAAQAQALTWLTSIARNAAIDSLRRRQTQPQLVSATADDDDDPDRNAIDARADDAPGPFDLLSRACDAQAIGHCIERLSGIQRQSVALAFYDGLSHAEVAQHLRQPLGSVKSWLRRALMSLKDCLQQVLAGDAGARAS
jgi:RNA polymerase sigma-70 factor (ECF subfamily)